MGTDNHSDFEVEERLLPAVALLSEGAPANGINLVPRWEAFLAQRMADQAKVAERPADRRPEHPRGRIGMARIAAALLLGIGFGALGAVGAGAYQSRSAAARGENSHGSAPAPHYSAEQQSLMFALLDRTAAPPEHLVRAAAVEMSGCVTCHERLANRFAPGRP